MKIKTTKKEKTFEPIELKITIESMDELVTLLAMANAPSQTIKDFAYGLVDENYITDNVGVGADLFIKLKKIYKSLV